MGRGKRKAKKESKGIGKVLIILLVLIIIGAGGFLGYKILKDKQNSQPVAEGEDILVAPVEEKKVQIFSGTDRPFAVMIDNHSDAWPQVGLQKAYMIYEIIVEGGETRLMALFKGANVEQIGPVRSARHYFIDYVMENDAIYAHFGQSPQAESDLKKYNINDINGIAEDGTTFWRVKGKAAPHNAVTSTEKLLASANNKKYKTKSTNESVLNYTTDEVNLSDGQGAISVTIPHSDRQTVKYVYDEANKVYKRNARGKAQTDWTTGENLTTKNIIITFCGYYITNGKAIKIKCTKDSRESKTVYKDLNGNVIKVNDGNTFVNICPINANVVIEAPEATSTTTNATN